MSHGGVPDSGGCLFNQFGWFPVNAGNGLIACVVVVTRGDKITEPFAIGFAHTLVSGSELRHQGFCLVVIQFRNQCAQLLLDIRFHRLETLPVFFTLAGIGAPDQHVFPFLNLGFEVAENVLGLKCLDHFLAHQMIILILGGQRTVKVDACNNGNHEVGHHNNGKDPVKDTFEVPVHGWGSCFNPEGESRITNRRRPLSAPGLFIGRYLTC